MQMKRFHWAIAAMAIAWPAATPCRADVTYTILNYPTLQTGTNGGTYTISGTVTTDGAPLLVNPSQILSWSLTATDPVPGNPTLTLSSALPGAAVTLNFTQLGFQIFENSEGIFLPTGPGGQNEIGFSNGLAGFFFGSFGIPGTGPGHWATQGEATP
jgi:hypothetical protein